MWLRVRHKQRARVLKKRETVKNILQALPRTFNALKRETGLSAGTLSRYLQWMTKLHAVKKLGPIYVDNTSPVKKKDGWVLGADMIRNRGQFRVAHRGKSYRGRRRPRSLETDHEAHIDLTTLEGYAHELSTEQRLEKLNKSFFALAEKAQEYLSSSLRSLLYAYLNGKWQLKDGRVVYEQGHHVDQANRPCSGRVRRVGMFEIYCEKCGQRLHL